MRPTSIIYFERLSLLYILAHIVFLMITWDSQVAAAERFGPGVTVTAISEGLGLALLLLLIFLISRKGLVIAKWIFVILFAVGLAFLVPRLVRSLDLGLVGLLQLTELAIQMAAIYFLFTPEARDWFRGRPAPERPS